MHDDHLPATPDGDRRDNESLPATRGQSLQQGGARPLALEMLEERRPADDDEIDLLAYWRMLVKRKWLVAGVAGVGIVLALVATLMATPMYRATTVVQIERADIPLVPGSEAMAAMFFWDPEFLATQIEVIKSRSLALRVAEDMGLDSAAVARMRPQSWFQRLKSLFGPDAEEPDFTEEDVVGDTDAAPVDHAADLAAGAGLIQGGVMVEPVMQTRLVHIRFTSPFPEFAARAANAVADGFIASQIDRRLGSNDYAKDYLEEQLALAKSRLEQSERDLVAFAQKENLVSSDDGPSLVGRNLADLNASLAEAQSQRIRTQAAWDQVSGGGALPAAAIQGSILNTLQQQRAGLRAQYQQQLQTYKPEYPTMQALQGQIDEVDRQIEQERAGVRASIRADYDAALLREQLLRTQLDELRTQSLDVDDRSVDYNILRREADTNRQLYDGLLQRFQQVNAASDLRPNNITIVDRARAPGGPFTPNAMRNVLIGLFLGLLLGVALALVLEFLDDTIRTPEDLEQHLRLPLLGIVPKLKKTTVEAALDDPRSAFSEAYRSVRTALQFSTDQGVPKVLLVTSPAASEGKSTTALTLARNFSQLGKRVLLVEADLRNPSLHRAVGVRSETGLSSLLAGAASASRVILNTDDERLDVILAGPLPPNPAELLAGSRLLSLLTVAAEKYDQVIIDGPPVLGIADAPILSHVTGGTLLVVQSGSTRIKTAQAALKRLAAARARIIGALLTHYDSKAAGYGYDYDSYYAYGTAPRIGNG